jgi:hypothetical protein
MDLSVRSFDFFSRLFESVPFPLRKLDFIW